MNLHAKLLDLVNTGELDAGGLISVSRYRLAPEEVRDLVSQGLARDEGSRLVVGLWEEQKTYARKPLGSVGISTESMLLARYSFREREIMGDLLTRLGRMQGANLNEAARLKILTFCAAFPQVEIVGKIRQYLADQYATDFEGYVLGFGRTSRRDCGGD